jgi:hypothetical protein
MCRARCGFCRSPLTLEVFHRDHRLGFRQVRGELVQEVMANVADPPVQPSQPGGRLLPVLRPLLLFAVPPPQQPQVPQQRPRAPGSCPPSRPPAPGWQSALGPPQSPPPGPPPGWRPSAGTGRPAPSSGTEGNQPFGLPSGPRTKFAKARSRSRSASCGAALGHLIQPRVLCLLQPVPLPVLLDGVGALTSLAGTARCAGPGPSCRQSGLHLRVLPAGCASSRFGSSSYRYARLTFRLDGLQGFFAFFRTERRP